MMDEYKGSLQERGIAFRYDEKACQWLAEHAIGGKSGARDLRNLIRRQVEDKITAQIVENADTALDAIAVTADDTGIVLETL